MIPYQILQSRFFFLKVNLVFVTVSSAAQKTVMQPFTFTFRETWGWAAFLRKGTLNPNTSAALEV